MAVAERVQDTPEAVYRAAADRVAAARILPHQDLPEPQGMLVRIAEDHCHPLSPLAGSLRDRNWVAPLDQITQDTGQNPDRIRKIADLLPGVFGIRQVEGMEMVFLV